MRQAVALLVVLMTLLGYQPPREGCGYLFCVSSPYLQARGRNLAGSDIATAINVMGGAPDSSYDIGGSMKVLTWTRRQDDHSVGLLVCTESLTVGNGLVISTMQRGNCGV